MDAENYRKSLDDRLKNEAKAQDLPVNTIRQHEAIKRFIMRLLKLSDSVILKGAVALESRLILADRQLTFRTGDLDLSTNKSSEELLLDIAEACGAEGSDLFEFRVLNRRKVEARGYPILQATIEVRLAGRQWQQFPVDIVGNELLLGDQIEFVTLGETLDGEQIDHVPIQSVANALAEKLKAYSTVYGGHRSSRYRDLPDMVILSQLAADTDLKAGALRSAVEKTFGSASIPTKLPEPPPYWPEQVEPRVAEVTGEVAVLFAEAKSFWDPVLSDKDAIGDSKVWGRGGWQK